MKKYLIVVLLLVSCTTHKLVQKKIISRNGTCNERSHVFPEMGFLMGGYEKVVDSPRYTYLFIYPNYEDKRCLRCGVTYPVFTDKPKVKVLWKKK